MEDRMEVVDDEDDSGDDSEGPVVVGLDDLAAAGQRNAAWEQAAVQQRERHGCVPTNDDKASLYGARYPILFAAVQPHEDVLMTCARALEAAADVSLVREAAAYLEQVEDQQSRG
jgi:A1 cistron-splicing factor AAR2